MSKISRSTDQQLNHQYLLILDTPAILSARANNPEIDWQNNLQLGQCYIPDLAWHELLEFACQGHRKAKKFIKFINTQQNYNILYQENTPAVNSPIALPKNVNSRNRSILASALNLASQWIEQIVVFVTYDVIADLLITEKALPYKAANFCILSPQDLNWWYREGLSKRQVPSALAQTLKIVNCLPQPKHSLLASDIFFTPGGGKNNTKLKLSSYPSQLLPVDNSPPPRQKVPASLQTKLIGWSMAAIAIGASPFLANYFSQSPQFIKQITTNLRTSIQSNSQPQTTSEQLIKEAETALLNFQKTKESEQLKKTLSSLQEFKNKNNLVDQEIDNYLSKLKHKYAIEVLASSDQIEEAVNMLQEIPSSYSEIEQVKNWLEKNSPM